MGFLSLLLMLPVILIMFALIWLAASTGTTMGIFGIVAVAVALIMIVAAITTTADAIFKALLFAYATGRTLPEDVDVSQFSKAFRKNR
jgi:hypothetical protein